MIRVNLVKNYSRTNYVHLFILPQSHVAFQNGEFLNVNNVDPNLENLELHINDLSTVYLGRCDYESDKGCTNPEAKFSDYNAWLGELSTQEIIHWTTCL